MQALALGTRAVLSFQCSCKDVAAGLKSIVMWMSGASSSGTEGICARLGMKRWELLSTVFHPGLEGHVAERVSEGFGEGCLLDAGEVALDLAALNRTHVLVTTLGFRIYLVQRLTSSL